MQGLCLFCAGFFLADFLAEAEVRNWRWHQAPLALALFVTCLFFGLAL